MAWSTWICETRTGAKLVRVPEAEGKFSHRLSGGTGGSSEFVITKVTDSAAAGYSVLRDDALTLPWATTLVRCWNDVPKYAGLIEADGFNDDDQTLTLTHVDIDTFLGDSRYPFGVTSYWADEPNHVPGALVIAGKNYSAAVAKVVEQGLLGPSAIYSLPIVLPSTATAGAFSSTYHNYNFQNVGDILADFRALGVDIEFEPRWSSSDTLEWVLRVGTDASPSLVGDVFEFNQTAAKRRLTGVRYKRDGKMQLTGQFGIGAGSEALMRVGGDGIGGASTIPARDAAEFYKTETSEVRLAAYGSAAVAAQELPTKQWEMSMLAGEEPGLENVRLGSIFRMFWKGSPRIPDGSSDVRVIGLSFDESDRVVIDAQTWS